MRVGCRFRRLGATLPIAEVDDGGHLSLSHILFDENYGLPAPADGVALDALIHLYAGTVRFEHCGWSRNKHQFPIAIVEPTATANVYAHPDMTVQVRPSSTVLWPPLDHSHAVAVVIVCGCIVYSVYLIYSSRAEAQRVPCVSEE